MSVLEEICTRKAEHVEARKSKTHLAELQAQILDAEKPRGFINALKTQTSPALIAEVKKASPSKGVIREDFDPVLISHAYERAGATCLSVLTDEPYFQGRDEYLMLVKNTVQIPVLRKDFMIDPYQIYESRALGADCILIIMAALSDEAAKELYETAKELEMDALIEVHNQEELARATTLNAEMIGVNNRNLKTLNVDIQTSFDLLTMMPENTLCVAESGISKSGTIQDLYRAGYEAFLVGESLMKQNNIEDAVHNLLGTN